MCLSPGYFHRKQKLAPEANFPQLLSLCSCLFKKKLVTALNTFVLLITVSNSLQLWKINQLSEWAVKKQVTIYF